MGILRQMLMVLVMMVSLQGWLPLGCLEEERIALLQLKDSFNYPNGTSLPSWRKGDAHCCSWEGIECNSNTGRVTELDLGSIRNQESGDWYLNASLFLPFQELNTLYLMDNRIAGWVKNKDGDELLKLSNLENLYLDDNLFNNSILSSIEGLSSLKSLNIGYNRLEGLIDLKESLSNLEFLDLSGNNINKLTASGDGDELLKLSNLEKLYLDNNLFNNSILSSIEGLSSLKSLSIGYNRLEGLIDLKESLSNLEFLDLSGNNINKLTASEGPSNLSTLYLENITTYGSSFQFQQSLGAFSNLTTLGLSYNDFRGRIIGDELQNLSSLDTLYLEYCSLDENSLQRLGALTSLKDLFLNALRDTVPYQAFLNLKNLERLDLSGSTLDNSILQTIEKMTSLKTLSLQSCRLNGRLPTVQERQKLKEDPLNFNVLNIIVEVVSAYGSAGFTTAYNCDRQIQPDSNCVNIFYGFSKK